LKKALNHTAAAPVAAAKLFTVGGGLRFVPLALPPMNNFG
jgi:hypothetical protein